MNEDIQRIYRRTDGRCHICGKKLCLSNYGLFGRKGAWEIEHSVAWANGGSDRLNNLYPACMRCNRQKGTVSTRTARRWNGRTRAPLSRTAKEKVRSRNSLGLATAGGLLGGRIGGPWGLVIGAGLGYLFGDSIDPESS
jgi:hypothetical protein